MLSVTGKLDDEVILHLTTLLIKRSDLVLQLADITFGELVLQEIELSIGAL